MDWLALTERLGGIKGELTWWQMSIRGLVVFAYGLLLVRFPGQRIFGKSTAFDIVLAVLVGSNLSRALTGNAPFAATLAATTAIVLVHWLVAHLATRSRTVSWLVKGAVVCLVSGGRVDRRRMRRHGLTEGDLEEAMREAGVDSLARVEAAYLERNGKVSIVRRS
jgi:uncharacterized membrane protein YcaP (DUF421 family)